MIRKILPKSASVRNVGILVSGTTLAQAIPIAITPILTRLYTPEDFGLVALYVSCVSILSIVATGRYELAITLPESDQDAANLVVLALKLCALVSALLLIPIVLFGVQVAHILGNPSIAPWFYLLPVSVMALGAFNVFELWLNRSSRYKSMASNRLRSAAFTSATSLGLGWAKVSAGQLWAATLGPLLAASFAAFQVLRTGRRDFQGISLSEQKRLARRYQQHPRHLLPAQMIGAVAMQIPVFMMSSAYSLAIAGHFSLAYRLVTLPTGLIANAIGDVYRQRIAVEYQEKGEFTAIYIKTVKLTMALALLPCIAMYFAAPSVFSIVLGEQWSQAGEYAQILVVAAFFQFSFTPIDKGAVLVGATRYILLWHLVRLVLLLLLLMAALFSSFSIQSILWAFVFVNGFLYLWDAYVEYLLSRRVMV